MPDNDYENLYRFNGCEKEMLTKTVNGKIIECKELPATTRKKCQRLLSEEGQNYVIDNADLLTGSFP